VSQALDRGAQAVARGAATLTQQEKNNSAGVQRNMVNNTGFICTVVKLPLQRYTFHASVSLTVASRLRCRMFYSLLRRLRLRQKSSAWNSGSPVGGRRVAECLGRWRALPCASRQAAERANDNSIAGSASFSGGRTRSKQNQIRLQGCSEFGAVAKEFGHTGGGYCEFAI